MKNIYINHYLNEHCSHLVELELKEHDKEQPWTVHWKAKGALLIWFLKEMLAEKLTEEEQINYVILMWRFISETLQAILATEPLSYLADIADCIVDPRA